MKNLNFFLFELSILKLKKKIIYNFKLNFIFVILNLIFELRCCGVF